MSGMVLYQTFRGLSLFLTVVSYLLVGYCILSWFVRPTNGLFQFLSRMVQPLLAPFRPIARKLIERGFMIDVSVLFAFVAINLLQRLLWVVFDLIV